MFANWTENTLIISRVDPSLDALSMEQMVAVQDRYLSSFHICLKTYRAIFLAIHHDSAREVLLFDDLAISVELIAVRNRLDASTKTNGHFTVTPVDATTADRETADHAESAEQHSNHDDGECPNPVL